MSQVSPFLRRSVRGYTHWCPGCKEMHTLFDSWTFVNNDLNKPTFSPSFRHSGFKTINDEYGNWLGEWERDANNKPIPDVCHYILTDGILNYCNDCTHELKGQSVPLPELPIWLRD